MAFQHVFGHKSIVEFFRRTVRQGRLGHAYLFVGPDGVGKRRLAMELAHYLLCESPVNDDSCGACEACRLTTAGTHPDLFVVARPEEKNEFPIEIMRDLCENFTIKSARGKGKFAIVDDSDDLNEQSANCFLKTLEEPPPRSCFFLIGTGRERQMPTILSRCQVIRFARLSDESVAVVIGNQSANNERIRLSDGSPGRAVAFADDELWRFRCELLELLASETFDIIEVSKNWIQFIEKAGKDAASQRRRALLTIHLVVDFFREVLAYSEGGRPKLTSDQESNRAQHLSSLWTIDQIMEAIDRCFEAERQIPRYVQSSLVIEGLVDSFAAFGLTN